MEQVEALAYSPFALSQSLDGNGSVVLLCSPAAAEKQPNLSPAVGMRETSMQIVPL